MKRPAIKPFQHRARVLALALSAAAIWRSSSPADGQEPGAIRLEVDSREISRKLLHAREEIPVRPGKLALWFPKWVPGTHSPGGPVQNIGGLRLETPQGAAVPWRRDETEPCRLECAVPEHVDTLVVRLDYICNQPSVNSTGVDSFGNGHLGVINWNTCLLYPENASIDDVMVSLRLLLPPRWRFGTALRAAQEADSSIVFKTETLRDLVDSPLICGEFLRTIDLKAKNMPPVWLHLVSESAEAVQIDDKAVGKYRKLAAEAGALFGGAHFQEYHFLVTCSDEAGSYGVEHLSSSLNGLGERDLVDEKKRAGFRASGLLPHEFSHSWCGKHRRPAGMLTKNFHTPERTSLLWVYEGLTEYLGEVLMVRSGLLSIDGYRPELVFVIDTLSHREGRRWRPLEDTAIASHILRAPSPGWGSMRRSQDYYREGELLWMEADAIIRQETDGRRSLDDFCKKFMGADRKEKIVTYELADLIQTLKEVADHDWAKFIHERVDVPQTELPLSVVERCGYRLQYANRPSEFLKDYERDYHYVVASDSIGLLLNDKGQIRDVFPGMAADKAGLAPGMEVLGVNGRKYSANRLNDSLAESVTRRQIEFLVIEGDTLHNFTLHYADGSKYLELVRDPTKPDLLAAILSPLVSAPP